MRMIALSCALLLSIPATAADWPCFLGPTGDSISPEKGILTRWPRQGLRVVWYKQVGAGYAVPSIARGRLYQFDRHDNQARLSCLDPKTGREHWKFEYATAYEDRYNYSNGPRCCPVIDEDRVYVYGPEGMLHCVRDNGKELWKVDTKKQYGIILNFFGVGSTPVVEGDLLLVVVGGSPKESEKVDDFGRVKPNGTAVVAFDKRTGKERWQSGNDLAGYASPVLATIHGRRYCFAFCRSGLLALDPATGKEYFHFRWRAKAYESVNAANPVVVGDKVFLSETYGPGSALLQIKPDGSHKVLWQDGDERRKRMQCHWMTPIYHDGYLYGCSGRHDAEAELRCIDLATGKVQWSEPRLYRTSLLMVDGHFVCLGEYGELRLLKVNPQRYEEVVPSTPVVAPGVGDLLESPCWAAPVLCNGLLYLRGKNYLVCLELIPKKK